MKKRVVALLMVAVLCVGFLSACNSSNKNDDATNTVNKTDDKTDAQVETKSDEKAETKSDEEITLTLWHIENDAIRLQVMERCIARFQESYPNVKVEAVAMENDPYKTKLNTVMAAGGEPDIFVSWGGGWLKSFVDEGKVLDIDKEVRELSDIYYDSALSLFEIENKYWAVPFRAGAAPVYYNTKIYEEYNLEVPETLEDLEANCEILIENGIIPFALGNSSQWPGALEFIWLSLRNGGSQTFLDAYNRTGNATFEDQSFINAGAKIQEWVKKGYYPEGANGINYDTGGSRMLFYTGQAAHIVQTNAFISNCKSEEPDFYANNLGIFNYPVIEGAKGSSSEILGGGNGYSISAASKHPKEALELVKMMSDQVYAQDCADNAGITTGIKGVVIKDAKLQLMDDLLVNSSYMQNFYDQFLPPELGSLHKQTTYDLFGLTTTPEKAAADMEALAQKELGQ